MEKLEAVLDKPQTQAFSRAAEEIENRLPNIEASFLDVRHFAQDLLHWVQKFSPGVNDKLLAEYRSAYGQLISMAPQIKPHLQQLHTDLIGLSVDEDPIFGHLTVQLLRIVSDEHAKKGRYE